MEKSSIAITKKIKGKIDLMTVFSLPTLWGMLTQKSHVLPSLWSPEKSPREGSQPAFWLLFAPAPQGSFFSPGLQCGSKRHFLMLVSYPNLIPLFHIHMSNVYMILQLLRPVDIFQKYISWAVCHCCHLAVPFSPLACLYASGLLFLFSPLALHSAVEEHLCRGWMRPQ